MKPDGCVYQGPTEHSSAIASVHRRTVVTRSGNCYQLGRLDARVARVLGIICSSFDPEDPLNPDTRAQLLYAERLVYGPAHAPLGQLLAALQAAEGAMAFPEAVGPQFAAIRQILHAMGIVG